jgi:dolichol kinase
MIAALLSLALVFILLVTSEGLWRAKRLRGELGRKLVHILVGSFVAFWPFYLSFSTIQVISLAFLAGVLVSRKLSIFQAVSKSDRRTWGDVLFAVAIGIIALLAHNNWIFWAAIMHLGLADGLAAVIGKQFGTAHRYKVFGHTKSVVGTATFIILSIGITATSLKLGHLHSLTLPLLVGLPLGAALLENLGVIGFDNLLVPLFVALILNRF